MIPRRVCLRGFLCYREEQEIDFGGETLWMLAGLNGSGKSAVFDAVTYALFGHHRGGGSGAAELINKDSDGFAVEFDFLLDGDVYRVKRTLKKGSRSTSATQQVLRFRPPGEAAKAGKWEPVPDTGRKAEFDAWVRDHIGLNYDTFTASVLLLQGKAERLLDSSPRGRFDVLAGIVDLERYIRLHERADERRRVLKTQVEALQSQIDATPEVDAAEFAAVEKRTAQATAERDEARAALERCREIEVQARRWMELTNQRSELEQRWQRSQALIAEADAIERDFDRLRDLQAALPHLEAVIKLRADFVGSENKSAALTLSRDEYQEKLATADHAVDQAKKKRAALNKSIGRDEQKQRELAARLETLSGLMTKVEMYEAHDTEARRLEAELAELPGDLEAQVSRAQERHDELEVLARALPGLSRLLQARTDLVGAKARAAAAGDAEFEIKSAGEKLTAELTTLAPTLQALVARRETTDKEATSAKALLDHARRELESFRGLHGAKVCRACGQPLTREHFERETAKRGDEVRAAEDRLAIALSAREKAHADETSVRARHDSLERERQAKREEFREAQRRSATAREDIARLNRDCGREHAELPEPYRSRVGTVPPADWTDSAYPAADDVTAARKEAAGLEAARQQLAALRKQTMQVASLREQAARARKQRDRFAAEIAGEPAKVRQEHAGCRAEESSVAALLQGARGELRQNEAELDRLTAERQRFANQVVQFEADLRTEDAKRTQWRRAMELSKSALPPAWSQHADRTKLSDLHAWTTERDELLARDSEKRAKDLGHARSEINALRQRRADLDGECDSVPDVARRHQDELREAVQAARKAADECDTRLGDVQRQKGVLETRQKQRADLEERKLFVDREHKLQEVLARLLGRDRLQLYLVRQAERQIVDHANAVLDRLSGGQLSLRLRGGEESDESEKALELEGYNRVTGSTPIHVAFLSGSQRFRVAVSLALGIGQYASRQHRPIESVIIDEGFGCLDRDGRQVMIQELQNLRGHLKCILLVSHQEEFAEAFSDGYRFELEEGTTRVTRIQR
jgi:DNA repair exonuclease SbcCD ATPase subunit